MEIEMVDTCHLFRRATCDRRVSFWRPCVCEYCIMFISTPFLTGDLTRSPFSTCNPMVMCRAVWPMPSTARSHPTPSLPLVCTTNLMGL